MNFYRYKLDISWRLLAAAFFLSSFSALLRFSFTVELFLISLLTNFFLVVYAADVDGTWRFLDTLDVFCVDAFCDSVGEVAVSWGM